METQPTFHASSPVTTSIPSTISRCSSYTEGKHLSPFWPTWLSAFPLSVHGFLCFLYHHPCHSFAVVWLLVCLLQGTRSWKPGILARSLSYPQLLSWNLEYSSLQVSIHWMNEWERRPKEKKQQEKKRHFETLGTQQALSKCSLTLKRGLKKDGVRREKEKSTQSIWSLTYPSYVSWILFRHLFCPRQWNFYNYFTNFAYSSLEIWRPQRNSSKPAGHTTATETMWGWTFLLSVSHPDLSGLSSQSGYELVYLPCPSLLFIFPTSSLPGTESFTYLEKSQ